MSEIDKNKVKSMMESFIDRSAMSTHSGDLMTSNYAANVLDNGRVEPIGKYGFIRGMENK